MMSVPKGTVVPLSDTISVAEAEKAARQVKEEIEKQQEYLRELQGYRDEAKTLSKLVTGLPDSVSYSIMVPFGKAAFFPGRLIHTNEFLVLLGEGYWSERSAKQTVGILERRNEFLQNKIANIESHIADLEAEASFASNTAAEAKAGVVEIREQILEGADERSKSAMTRSENFDLARSKLQSEARHLASPSYSAVEEDEEHSRIIARIEALEAAEEAAVTTSDEEGMSDQEGSTSNEEDVDDAEAITKSGSYLSKEQKANLIKRLNMSEAEDFDGGDSDEDSGSGTEEEYDLEEDEEEDKEDRMHTRHSLNVGADPVRSDQGKGVIDVQADGSKKAPRPLSRFGREVQSVRERLDSELASRMFASPSQGIAEKLTPSVGDRDASCSGLEIPNMRGEKELQKELTEWRARETEMQGFVLGPEAEGSSAVEPKIDQKIDQKLDKPERSNTMKSTDDQKTWKPTTRQTQAFTGKVTEHISRPTFPGRTGPVIEQRTPVTVQRVAGQVYERITGPSSKSEQVEEPPAKPVSKFKQRRQGL
ncbi:hypothetical protein R1flu_025396 [Riccia fluitans]|uniref:Uncharacterized protein n=1 Tax=Riccia fluitans TaxID=41844 RepID=A0ABD1XXN9_9MARC